MPRPRKPSDVHDRSGAFAHNPGRRRKDPRGVGKLPPDPPAHLELNKWETKAWQEIAAAIPAGVGTGSDAFVVEMAARITGAMRKSGEHGSAELGQLRYLLGSLGLTPTDRLRLSVAAEEPEDDGLEEFRQPRAPGPRPVGGTLKLPGPRKPA